VLLELAENEKRFGFSVVGGVDEGFRPRIDEIVEGSVHKIYTSFSHEKQTLYYLQKLGENLRKDDINREIKCQCRKFLESVVR
jgi:hypothetical protein